MWTPSAESSINGPKSFVDCFEKMRLGISLQSMGFSQESTEGKIRRFCYRWRFANSFDGLNLVDYHDDTVLGYSGLAKVFFSFSVLERFLELINEKWHNCVKFITPREIDTLYSLYQKTDIGDRLTDFLIERANDRLKKEIS